VKPWDYAAGMLLVKEAGGLITNSKGLDFRLGDKDIVAGSESVVANFISLVTKNGEVILLGNN